MTDDATLLQAFRSGDESAFATVAERYQSAIQAACQRQAPVGEVDDCVQAVFLVLARRPAAAARSQVLLAWLHQVAVYVCRDARRAATRRRKLVTNVHPAPATGNTPENVVLDRLDAAMLALDERQRAAVLLHATGTANDDIAQSLGVTTANASKLVHRGLAALRERLCRSGTPVGASLLLTVITTDAASGATAPPLTIHALNHASTNASLLAKGTIMHLTMTTTSTWMLTASLVTALGVGALVASEALAQPPSPPRQKAEVVVEWTAVPTPVPVLTGWEKEMDDRLQQRITFAFEDTNPVDIMRFFHQATGLNIVIHPDISAVSGGTPITMKAKEMSVRAALNHLANMLHARYLVVDQAVLFCLRAVDDEGRLDEAEHQLSNAVGTTRETTWGKDILKNLDQTVTLDLQDSSLQEVLGFLQKTSDSNIVIDPTVLSMRPPPVTLRVESMKLRFVLNHVMRLYGLRYQLRDEAVFITQLDIPE